MAQIQTETVVVTISRLVKENEEKETILTDEITTALEQVVQELVGTTYVVEAEIA